MIHIFLNPDYDLIALLLMFLAGAGFGWGLRGLGHDKDAAYIEMLKEELARMTQMRGNVAKEAHLAEEALTQALEGKRKP